MLACLAHGVLPIINENDVVVVDEIRVGDNDTLSALAANLVDADLLLILSDIDGLYTADPRRDPSARLIPEVRAIDESVYALAGGSGRAALAVCIPKSRRPTWRPTAEPRW